MLPDARILYTVQLLDDIIERESIEIYIFFPVFPSCCVSRIVKQPNRAKHNIIIHDPFK